MTQPSNLLSDEKLEQIAAGKMWDFHGGVHPVQNKQQSNQTAITDAGIPDELIIAVEQKGHIPQLLVEVGDSVLKGQPLTKVYGALVVQHASSSGTVKAIEPRTDCHPSGLPVLSVVIETDGLDRPFPSQGFEDYRKEIPATLIEAVQQAGVVGLGGAGFATHLKLAHSENRLLIVNAIECEPYITSDDRLIQEHADEIIEGMKIMHHILKPKLMSFAIEDNKPEAIEAFKKSLQALPEAERDNIVLSIVATRYPSGSAKQLIEVLTGEQTPIGKHSSELGIVMLNVGTVFAVKEAVINGKSLVSRIVTITGDAFARKGNASVRIGTPIQYLLDKYWLNALHHQKLVIGGPMMGFSVTDTAMPVSKICNCILAPTDKELAPPEEEMNCIRCSECAEACPVELLPQQLLWYSQSEDHKKLEEYDLSACIECGACAYVCPSHIPLVEYYRVSKAQIKTANEEADKAAIARQRHEDRELRLETEKQQRLLKHKLAAEKRKQQMKSDNGGEDLVAAALARAKAKKQENTETEAKPTGQNSQVAAAIARAKAKKLANASTEKNEVDTSETDKTSEVDPKKAAVAAAIARAKAKKLANTSIEKNEADTSETDKTLEVDPKKAAVSAAIARAKAKKLANASIEKNEADTSEIDKTSEVDPKKAAVAAAIARAKAKKLANASIEKNEADTSETDKTSEVDPKKAAVAAAIARAKAKKLAKAAAEDSSVESVSVDRSSVKQNDIEKDDVEKDDVETTPEVDPKKAAIAAAVARAKAKKLAKSTAENTLVETNDVEATSEVDPKKAAIAAAVARAKAKKLAAQNVSVEQKVTTDVLAEPDNSEVIKQRELRKEQARLHKQKLAEQANSESNENNDIKANEDARHQAVNGMTENGQKNTTKETKKEIGNASHENVPVDDKKAKIAAVIAKAKAKKLAQKDQ
ncbi:electron transport complex subunit RsxC [Psychromonas sp. SP041]|uniref:electron transport complex subunit RsxC n=1 Tax=Psychromonas sp. SP041 TaxID=1365007 RepID=UPI0010C78B70|nr:electron transport complex subunit RsxC [Psychromonas sp. SP041]